LIGVVIFLNPFGCGEIDLKKENRLPSTESKAKAGKVSKLKKQFVFRR